MTTFLLIRHATNDTVGHRLAGRLAGISLNEAGLKQAEELANRIAHMQLSALYSSPLERALETAAPIAKKFGVQTIICDDFQEIDFGEWTNKTFEELVHHTNFQRFNSFRSYTRIPGGETMPEAQVRMITGIEKLCIKHPGETVALVSHADLIKATVAYYSGIHLDLFHRLEIYPASVSIIEVGAESVRVLCVNNTDGIKI